MRKRGFIYVSAFCIGMSGLMAEKAQGEPVAAYIEKGPDILHIDTFYLTSAPAGKPVQNLTDQKDEIYQKCLSIQSVEQARGMMTTITVPVWKLVNGNKVSTTMEITVNSLIADKFQAVFQEIYHGSQKFPVSDAGGFSWRGDTSKSEHNWGTAIDLNVDSNYCIYPNGTTVGDHWLPQEDPYSFYAESDVVKAFKNHGFSWGGDWPWAVQDYMHFSYFGT